MRNEWKYRDTNTGCNFDTTGLVGAIGFPSQGLTATTRVADRMVLGNLDLNLYCPIVNGNTDYIRLIIFQTIGYDPLAAPPTVAAVLESANVLSAYKYNSDKQFHIICDFKKLMTNVGNNRAIKLSKRCEPVIKSCNFLTGVADVYSGQLWYLAIGTQALGNNSSLYMRVWFTDTD